MTECDVDGLGLEAWTDPERERLLNELAAINEELHRARVELDDLRSRLASLTRFHDRLLAPLYAELDEINARIAERLARRSAHPDDEELASKARAQARQSAGDARATEDRGGTDEPPPQAPPRPSPTERARRLFRRLIKLCHPDLAANESERRRREEFTRRVNDAYSNDDGTQLQSLLDEWQADEADEAGPKSHTTSDLAAMVERARNELARVRASITRLRSTGLGWLLDAGDPVTEVKAVARRVQEEIHRQRETLERIGVW